MRQRLLHLALLLVAVAALKHSRKKKTSHAGPNARGVPSNDSPLFILPYSTLNWNSMSPAFHVLLCHRPQRSNWSGDNYFLPHPGVVVANTHFQAVQKFVHQYHQSTVRFATFNIKSNESKVKWLRSSKAAWNIMKVHSSLGTDPILHLERNTTCCKLVYFD